MSAITYWFLLAGSLFVLMGLTGSVLKRLPISSAVLYLLVGIGIGQYGSRQLHLDPMRDTSLIEVLTEVAVTISLFTTGLKLGPALTDKRWWIPARLAFVGMTLTVIFITVIGYTMLALPIGAAVLLGGILAPTDPVLAADVQVEHHQDKDRLRFGLSGEAGFNDGSAFPFVMLGLGLLGLHDLGAGWWKWIVIDVVWAVVAGIVSGFALGWLVARLVLYLRKVHKEAIGRDEFLTLGLIALSYGFALLIHSYGFLAVFAAGLALRRIEQHATNTTIAPNAPNVSEARSEDEDDDDTEVIAEPEAQKRMEKSKATDPEHAPAHLTESVLSFNEQLERIGEAALVVLIGSMLTTEIFSVYTIWFFPLLFLIVRPIAVWLSLVRSRTSRPQRWLFSWFGIRGIGSLYYLTYAINHGLPATLALQLTHLTLAAIAISIFAHGISVTPLMGWYQKQQGGRKARA